MEKSYTIGSWDFTLERPGEEIWDRYINLGIGSQQAKSFLLVNGVKSPPPEQLQQILAVKPAIEDKLEQLIQQMAGFLAVRVKLDDPLAGQSVYLINEHRVVLKPVARADYQRFRREARRNLAGATARIVSQCLAEPSTEQLAAITSECPAFPYHIAEIIDAEAGGDLEVAEKK